MKIALREYLPLKQGLRHHNFSVFVRFPVSPRVSSIKTRIKTPLHLPFRQSEGLREYLPLKQGLRHCLKLFVNSTACRLREYLPLKQGLRPMITSSTEQVRMSLREYLPLKQGLRLAILEANTKFRLYSESIFH